MPKQQILYKVLGTNGEACQGGNGTWNLPRGKRPGKWMPPIVGELVRCSNAYHLCKLNHLLDRLGPTIWFAEVRGEAIIYENEIITRQARLLAPTAWNDSVARLFACDCATRALNRITDPDPHSLAAIGMARSFARGMTTQEELAAAWAAAWAAARAAAWAAARAAARAAAWDAAWAAARAATWAAAWAAARAAARDAARTAAWAAERRWQLRRLQAYLDGRNMRDIPLRNRPGGRLAVG